MTAALFKLGDCVRPRPEWRGDPNKIRRAQLLEQLNVEADEG
jgi:hypothetical protein